MCTVRTQACSTQASSPAISLCTRTASSICHGRLGFLLVLPGFRHVADTWRPGLELCRTELPAGRFLACEKMVLHIVVGLPSASMWTATSAFCACSAKLGAGTGPTPKTFSGGRPNSHGVRGRVASGIIGDIIDGMSTTSVRASHQRVSKLDYT